MTALYDELKGHLISLREQGMQISDINPVSALADMVSDRLYHGDVSLDDIAGLIANIGDSVWQSQATSLHHKSGLAQAQTNLPDVVTALQGRDVTKPLYRAVFTAHPVFALQHQHSLALCDAAATDPQKAIAPDAAYQPRQLVTLQDEHAEAMAALRNARTTIRQINSALLSARRKTHPSDWRDQLPVMIGVSTWVGYDLDGRSDITWLDTLILRVTEKREALLLYQEMLSPFALDALTPLLSEIAQELSACDAAIAGFAELQDDTTDDGLDGFTDLFNAFTNRADKLIDSEGFAGRLQEIAKDVADDDIALALLVIAADIATHGFGMGEIHLRINAVQLRNAMRAIDGRSLSSSDASMSSRLLIERLAERIRTEAPWQINFATIEKEAATARRQLMLAAQFLKHIDASQPIRLLIAECERPITYMSALYLAHKLGIKDKLDISPLFETSFGLEHGASMMGQLFEQVVVQDYIRRRGRIAIQLGFSDAGRFMGQLAANLAIERLQIKLIRLCARHFGGQVELLLFNTHGESLGRGCARPDMKARQDFILTPYARHMAASLGVRLYHQSSFQGGDGYRLFGTQMLADACLSQLILAETAPIAKSWQDDPLYDQSDFALDLFLSLKQWHEALFASPDYAMTLDIFGSNLLPKTGSRPAKRVVQAGNERRDPSKIRAIPHNAILQQLGFLAIVISGIGSAANVDAEQFAEIFENSPRLQQLISHVDAAKKHGSLNTMLSYARLLDNGFWIGRAYHGTQSDNQRAYRQLARRLEGSAFAGAIRQTAWRLRDDLIHLYRLFDKLSLSSPRTTGDQRLDLDLLHALRIAIITDSLLRVAKAPRFAESNRHSNADLINAALRLDFELAAQIIAVEFPDTASEAHHDLAEPDNYSAAQSSGYEATRAELLDPLLQNQMHIRTITQLISAHYEAHG